MDLATLVRYTVERTLADLSGAPEVEAPAKLSATEKAAVAVSHALLRRMLVQYAPRARAPELPTEKTPKVIDVEFKEIPQPPKGKT
jgi:hypothetical protein